MRNDVTGYRCFTRAAALLLPLCGCCFAECSVNTVVGTWGWQSHGTAMMTVAGSPTPVPVPFASQGIMQVDYRSKYTAYGTFSAGGQIQDFSFPGVIVVNADCTATDTFPMGPFEGSDRIVILANGNEMQWMPVKHPLGPVAGRAHFWRISRNEPSCTSEMVRGVYLGTAEGTYIMPAAGQSQPVPAAVSAITSTTFQFGGSGWGTATMSLGGSIFDIKSTKMSLQVKSDCTATLQWTATSALDPSQPITGTTTYIVLDHGNALIGMETKNSMGLPVKIESHKRVALMPGGF
jgi:hypothetical protein